MSRILRWATGSATGGPANPRVVTLAANTTKKAIVQAVMTIFGRGLQSASRHDPDVRREAMGFAQGFTIQLKVLPCGPQLTLRKEGELLRYLGLCPQKSDLEIQFKGLTTAFLLFTARLGIPQATAEHHIRIVGDPGRVMALVRCMNLLQGHLLPRFVIRRIMRRPPAMGLGKQLIRLKIYLLGITFGR